MSMDFFGSHPDLESAWPDFYALLDVAPAATADELRVRIRGAYVEALANMDHRHVERRSQYKMMAERIIPQARRILLEDQARHLYDQQLALHRADNPSALPYTRFVAKLAHLEDQEDQVDAPPSSPGDELPALPSPDDFSLPISTPSLPRTVPVPASEVTSEVISEGSRNVASGTNELNIFDQAHEVLRSEKKYAEMAPLPSVAEDVSDEEISPKAPPEFSRGERSRRERSPHTTPSSYASTVPVERTSNAASGNKPTNNEVLSPDALSSQSSTRLSPKASSTPRTTDFDDIPILASVTSEEDQEEIEPGNPNISAQAVAPMSALERQARYELAAAQARVLHIDPNQKPPAPGSEPNASEVAPQEEEARRARVLRVERGARPLTTAQLEASSGQDLGAGVHGIVSSGRDMASKPVKTRVSVGPGRNARRVLPQPALLALTALTSAGLMFLIARLQFSTPAAIPQNVAAATTLQIEYSNDLQPIMEHAPGDFSKTKDGHSVTLDLRSLESQDAMQAALSSSAAPPDAWIPAETLWSDRFNRLASQNKQPTITASRAIALSPLVLIARDDQASTLKRLFPNHRIASWDALRTAISTNAAHHFGLTDPHLSGAGAMTRWLMAREWSESHNLVWDKKANANANLWKWMSGFENNVPDDAASTDEMVQDLVLGNSDRFWWAIAYESDAIKWLRAGKPIQIFYLPETAYAEHPFCTFDRAGSSTGMRAARTAFETFLRSRATQIALAQNGFRPTEIRLADVPNNPFARRDWRARGLRENGFRIDQRLNTNVLDALVQAWKERY